MKQLKEIFGRKTSIWLSLELVLVTFACWWAFDPVIVTSYVTNLPLGYDPDRLVRFEVASTLPRQQQVCCIRCRRWTVWRWPTAPSTTPLVLA